jgi:hypothetical protein
MLDIRKSLMVRETLVSDMGRSTGRPIVRPRRCDGSD